MAEEKFELVSNYAPTGDQPQAIAQLVEGVQRGDRCQTLPVSYTHLTLPTSLRV